MATSAPILRWFAHHQGAVTLVAGGAAALGLGIAFSQSAGPRGGPALSDATQHASRGESLLEAGHTGDAAAELATARRMLQAFLAEHPASVPAQFAAAQTLNILAELHRQTETAVIAENTAARAVGAFRRLVAQHPGITDYRRDLGGSLHNLARIRADRGRIQDAIDGYTEALEYQRQVLSADPGNELAARFLTNHYNGLLTLLWRQRQHHQVVGRAAEFVADLPGSAEASFFASTHVLDCIPLARQDESIPELDRDAVAESYAQRGLEYLDAAVNLGVTNPDALAEPEFRHVAGRPGFAAIRDKMQRRHQR